MSSGFLSPLSCFWRVDQQKSPKIRPANGRTIATADGTGLILTTEIKHCLPVYGDMDDDGFYLGELRGQRGLVPSNFLTEAPPDYDPSQPRHKRQPGGMNDKGGQMQDPDRDSSYYG